MYVGRSRVTTGTKLATNKPILWVQFTPKAHPRLPSHSEGLTADPDTTHAGDGLAGLMNQWEDGRKYSLNMEGAETGSDLPDAKLARVMLALETMAIVWRQEA